MSTTLLGRLIQALISSKQWRHGRQISGSKGNPPYGMPEVALIWQDFSLVLSFRPKRKNRNTRTIKQSRRYQRSACLPAGRFVRYDFLLPFCSHKKGENHLLSVPLLLKLITLNPATCSFRSELVQP